MCLRVLGSYHPDIHLGLLLHTWREDWHELIEKFQCTSLNINYAALTQARIETIKKTNILLIVYVVNRKRRALKLLKQGVDAIFY